MTRVQPRSPIVRLAAAQARITSRRTAKKAAATRKANAEKQEDKEPQPAGA